MQGALEDIRASFQERITSALKDCGLSDDFARALGNSLGKNAIEFVPWSTHSLVTLSQAHSGYENILHLKESPNPPHVIYYRPVRAMSLITSVALGVAGAATIGPLVVALAAITGLLVLSSSDLRTVPSPAECLLFTIAYNDGANEIERPLAQQRFNGEVSESKGILISDFEPSLFSLIHLTLLRQLGTIIQVADKVIVH